MRHLSTRTILAVLLSVSGSFFGAATNALHADEITIGVSEFSREMNLLDQNSLVADLVRDGITQTLISLKPDKSPEGASPAESRVPAFDLALSDSVQVSADQSRWSFRMRKGSRFSNGNPVSIDDVVFAMRNCVNRWSQEGRPSVLTIGSFNPSISDPLAGYREEWLHVNASEGLEARKSAREILLFLGDCPIIEQASARLFGNSLGEGTNLVGSGPFELTGFEAGRLMVLKKQRTGAGVEVLNIRGFRDPLHSLTALRTGTVDVIFSDHEEVLARANKDQTLLISECSGYKIVHRRGLNVSCGSPIKVSELRYVS